MNEYEVVYRESMYGNLRTAVVEAEDEGDAIERAQYEDYYYGTTIEVVKQ